MKHSWVLLSLFLFVTISFNLCEAQETTLRVMTFHIRSAETADGKLNMDRIVATIQKGNPDLLALQGVDRNTKRSNRTDQAKYLAAQLKMNYVFAKTQNEDGGETGNAILSRFPIGQYKMLDLPRQGNSERGVLVALINIGKGKKGKEIRFVSTALGGGNSGQIRQLEKMNDYLFIEGEKTPVILGCHLYMKKSDAKSVGEIQKRWTDAFDVTPESTAENDQKIKDAIDKRGSYIFFRSDDPFKAEERQALIDPMLSYPPVLSVLTLTQ